MGGVLAGHKLLRLSTAMRKSPKCKSVTFSTQSWKLLEAISTSLSKIFAVKLAVEFSGEELKAKFQLISELPTLPLVKESVDEAVKKALTPEEVGDFLFQIDYETEAC